MARYYPELLKHNNYIKLATCGRRISLRSVAYVRRYHIEKVQL